MYKRIFNKLLIGLVIIFVLFITFTASTNSFAQTLSEEKVYCEATLEDEFADNRVLVVLDKSSSYSKNVYDESTFSKYNCTDVTELTYMSTSELRTNNSDAAINTSNYNKVLCLELANNSKSNVLNVIKDLIQREDVIYAGPDYKIAISSTIPNDSLLESQWAVDSIELSKAWDYTQGTHDILVGVMDTGIDGSHPDLSDSIVNNLCRDFTSGTEVIQTNPIDPNGHGTHVAGIIGGIGNNNKGVAGVNWNVGLVSLRVLDENGRGYSSYVANAINFAIKNKIPILNLSAGWIEVDKEYDFALEKVIDDYNGLLICASGNENSNNDGYYPLLPASIDLPNIISVGSHDPDNKKSSFSSYGKKSVDLFAPGEDILSTYPIHYCNQRSHIFNDGTRLCEISQDRYIDFLQIMNDNGYTFDELEEHLGDYWYKEDGSTVVPEDFTSSKHHQNGYHKMSGTSMAAPYVTGVAALLLSIDENLTTVQLKEAIFDSVTIPNNNGTNPLNNLCFTNGILNAYDAVKYVLKKYCNIAYSLSNYSSIVDTNKVVTSNTSCFNELNGFYKLNVTYAKNYEFIFTSTSGIDITLYNEDLNEISYDDLDSTNNRVHFIKNLNIGTYYLRTKYINEDSTGTINTKIISRNTAYLKLGENDILINSYNGIKDYNYINQYNAGFFKFTLVGEKADGSTIIYPSNALKVYKDSSRTQILQKFDLEGYDNTASLKQNENNMYVYLPREGYFYLDVNFNTTGLEKLRLVITLEIPEDLNLFNLVENTNETIDAISEIKKGDYFKKICLQQTGKFIVTFNYSGTQDRNILVLLAKENYDATINEYLLDTRIIALINKENAIHTNTLILEDGTYYIGYFNKIDISRVTVSFERLVTNSGSEVLVPDPDQWTLAGSQINIIESNVKIYDRSYRQNYITVGFTRLIYPNYNYGTSPSRLDYDWYSSDSTIATVTNYGTVLGKKAGVVKIMAVLKSDPSKVYVKEFVIRKNFGSGTVEIHNTYMVKYNKDTVNGKFHFNMEKVNCPYPWLQDYTWILNSKCHNESFSASMDYWGYITINGTGCFTLTGIYNVSSRYKVIVHFVVEQ